MTESIASPMSRWRYGIHPQATEMRIRSLGRVYVQLGKVNEVDFGKWCDGIAKGNYEWPTIGYAPPRSSHVFQRVAGANPRTLRALSFSSRRRPQTMYPV